ncbi:MAG: hypothetical protein CVU87_06710 [Firmicutes bacterium HGW-Firmicutes-12]|jgi:hypothetical protein|nr:MAG: hypothetical protein CVU87_06710 [Firmicutes bacterium HGW-Firmicutes-12]
MEVLKNNRGSITVFLVIVFTAFLVLAGVLVDAVRIVLAERQFKDALDSAVRSTMADSHEILAAEFGIYGAVLQEQQIEKYLRVNLKEQKSALNIIRYDNFNIEAEIDENSSLLNNAAFQEQILQYMKYKGPLVLGESLIDKLKDSNFKKKTTLMESGQKIITLRSELNKQSIKINRSIKALLISTYRIKKEEILQMPGDLILKMRMLLRELETGVLPALKEYEIAVEEIKEEDIARQALFEETRQINQRYNVYRDNLQNMIDILQRIKPNHSIDADLSVLLATLEGFEELALPLTYEKHGIEVNESGKQSILEHLNSVSIFKDLPVDDLIVANMTKKGELLFMVDPELYDDMEEESVVEEGQKVLEFLRIFTKGIEELVYNSRNNLYQTEFIMDKYTFLTSNTLRNHFLNKGEVEYIICGNTSELANMVMVFQRIWYFRFAVNVLENFLESKIPHPLARLVYALAEGFTAACTEVVRIYNGAEVPLFPDLPNVQMRYSDYLRIFLLLQEKDCQLNRMRQLIQINIRQTYKDSDFELADLQSKGIVWASAEIDLWFLPAQTFAKLGWDYFQDGKYKIVQSSIFSYTY